MPEAPADEELVERLGVQREDGYLYFLDRNGDVCRTPIGQRRGANEPELVARTTFGRRERGWLYYLNEDGNLARRRLESKPKKKQGARKPKANKLSKSDVELTVADAPAGNATPASAEVAPTAERSSQRDRDDSSDRVDLPPDSYRCLSIRQPWADLIVRGLKTVEVRTWSTLHRGTMLIHAGGKLDEHQDTIARFYKPDHEWEKGCFVGAVELDSVVKHPDRPGVFLWHLSNPRRLPPFAAKGKLQLYEVQWPPDGTPCNEARASRSTPSERTPVAQALVELLTDEEVLALAKSVNIESAPNIRGSVADQCRHQAYSLVASLSDEMLVILLGRLGGKRSKNPDKNQQELLRLLRFVSFDDGRDDLCGEFDEDGWEDTAATVAVEPGYAYGIGSDGLWRVGEREETQLAERFPDDFDPAYRYLVDPDTGQVSRTRWLTWGELHERQGDPVR